MLAFDDLVRQGKVLYLGVSRVARRADRRGAELAGELGSS